MQNRLSSTLARAGRLFLIALSAAGVLGWTAARLHDRQLRH